ncbi:MAG: tail fiber domain-containing protein [Chitinivibrionia bacterium]|nr:tail fiber domain-containing protein [Chitinivibrionia bacterium]
MNRFMCMIAILAACLVLNAWGEVPPYISYQGVLTDGAGAAVENGIYVISFALYETPAGGAPLWTQVEPATVSGGIFNVTLGPLDPPFDNIYYLGISVDGGPELSPRRPLASAPYALNTRTVQDSSIDAGKLDDGAAVRSLNGHTDHINLVAGNNIAIDALGNDFVIAAPGSGGVGGSGSAGQVAVWSGTSTLWGENALFWDNKNGRLGIGTPDPGASLNVQSEELYASFFSSDSLDDNTQVVRADFIGSGPYHATAVYGRSNPAVGYGIGGSFEGGRKGLFAFGNGGPADDGVIYGLHAEATGAGSESRYAVFGQALGPEGFELIGVLGFGSGATAAASAGVAGIADAGSSVRFGVYGRADAGGTDFYGVYGDASPSSNSAAVYASGDILYSGSLIGPPSDTSVKRNAQPLDGALSGVMRLEPKSFEFKTDDPQYAGLNLSPGNHFGLMAQELETVFPDLVETRTFPRHRVANDRGAQGPGCGIGRQVERIDLSIPS